HRGLVRAYAGNALEALFDAHLDRSSHGASYRLDLEHHLANQVAGLRRFQQPVQRSPAECADGVNRRVAEELAPDPVPNMSADRAFETGLDQRPRERLAALAARAVR